MQEINIIDKISIYGKIDNIDFTIKNKKVGEVIKYFYDLLKEKNINIHQVKKMEVSKVIFDNNIDKDNFFYLRGYANKKDADENSMRYYFNIRNFRFKNIYRELKLLYTEYLCYFEKNTDNLNIIIETLLCDNKEFNV